MRRNGLRALFVALLSAFAFTSGGQAIADGIGNAGSDARTGWYPDEQQISPQVVTGGTFGQLWSASVNGQVYAQPLLAQGTLVVATENDKVYGLDGNTGAQQWTKDLGTPWNPADLGCGDITPAVGTTSTPVIDTSTNPGTIYMTHKTYASGTSGPAAWYVDALNLATGQERAGFPVLLSGHADNASGATFTPTSQQQRPGLLLLGGVVYAAFGSHCDYSPYQGWVFGVSTAGQIKARWLDNTSGLDGAGIWQSGAGLTSDAAGSILLSTGNGESPSTPTAGNHPPSNLGNSVIRLGVQPNGTLKPVDFFTPYNASYLDEWDTDLGSGAVVALPNSFGTSSVPHTAIAVGKQGEVYLVNRDNLGGAQQGPGQGDAVIQELGPYGAAFGRAGVWPGDGGYAYITTDSGQATGGQLDAYKSGVDGNGNPTLAHVGNSSDTFGFGSGPVVVTSDNSVSGSALVWVVWSANRNGDGGELRAYNPVPVNGVLQEVYHYPIGHATNYSTPGVGGGKLYVGTRDGKVLAFGSPVSQPLSGSGASFPTTTLGQSSQQTLTLTANAGVTIQSASSSSSQFTLGAATPTLPATLAKGATLTIPVTFTPTGAGLQGGQITISTSSGSEAFSVSGSGQTAPPKLAADKKLLTLPGIAVGGHTSGTVTFSNIGAQTLTISAVHAPAVPFTLAGAPTAGTTIAPGGSVTISVNFDPTAAGTYNDALGLDSDGGNLSVGLSGTASTPGQLQISPLSTDYGNVVVGDSVSNSFTVKNVGGTTVTINKSKPPFGAEFSNTTSLNEGSTIQPGETVTESVTFAPTATGAASGSWQITGDDSTGLHVVQFSGTGISLLGGSAPTFGTTTVGQSSSPQTMTLTANKALTLQDVTSSSGQFTLGTVSPARGTAVASGGTISVPITFSPTAAGTQTGQITVTTSAGQQSFSVSGMGQLPPPKLTVDQTTLAFGSAVTGSHATKMLTYTNTGGQALTTGAVHAPAAPFSLTGAPATNTTIAPGSSITVTVNYDPTAAGSFNGSVGLDSDGGNVSTTLSGSAVTPGALQVTPTSIDFGKVVVGDAPTNSFTVKNTGGTAVTINTSTPPSAQGFSGTTALNAGTIIQPGASVQETVKFAPTSTGAASASWVVTGNDSTGQHTVSLAGTGVTLLGGSGVTFGTTTVGQTSSPQTLTVTANKALTVQSIATSGPFAVGTSSPTLPASLAKGATISVPVTFSPTASGTQSGQVTVTTSAGQMAFAMSGTGQLAPPKLSVDQTSVGFGSAVIGSHTPTSVTYTNTGAQTLTISAVHSPSAPFSLTGAPGNGSAIAPGKSITVTLNFDPTNPGSYSDAVGLDSDGGNVSTTLSGAAVTPGQLQVTPTSIDFGTVTLTDSAPQSFTVKNIGGSAVKITTSAPPSGQGFTATTALNTGTTLQPGASAQETVTFAPTSTGAANDSWTIAGDDATGSHTVTFGGIGRALLGGSGLTFAPTTLGENSQQTLTLTANTDLTVNAIDMTGPFALGDSPPSLPVPVPKGSTISIPVSFSPTDVGPVSGTLTVTTDGGSQTFSLAGTGASQTTTSSSTTESITSKTSSTTTTTSTTDTTTTATASTTTTGHLTAHVPSAPKLLPAIVTTTKLSSVYVSYAATAVADAKFTLEREAGGRLARVTRSGKVTRSCVPNAGQVPRTERCTRYVTVATFSHRDRVGKVRIRVTASVSWRKLVPGIYRLSSVLFDTAGAKHTFRTSLRVNLPPPKHPLRHTSQR